MIDVESSGLRRLPVEIRSQLDPTGSPPLFALTTGRRSDPSGYVAGTWASAWSALDGRVDAWTPTIGDSGSLVVAAGSIYDLWVQLTTSLDQPEHRVGAVRAL
jgi:hypothetical protein